MQPHKQRYERLLFPQRQSFRCRRKYYRNSAMNTTIAFFTSLGLLTKARRKLRLSLFRPGFHRFDLLKSELDRLHVKITTDVTATGTKSNISWFYGPDRSSKAKGRCCNPCLRRESEFQARIRRKWLCTWKAARTYDGCGLYLLWLN